MPARLLPDEDVLVGATESGRALVTANIKDFMPIDARCRVSSRSHAGLVMVSSKTFPQSRGYVIAVTSALDALLAADGCIQPGGVVFLARSPGTGSGAVGQRIVPYLLQGVRAFGVEARAAQGAGASTIFP